MFTYFKVRVNRFELSEMFLNLDKANEKAIDLAKKGYKTNVVQYQQTEVADYTPADVINVNNK